MNSSASQSEAGAPGEAKAVVGAETAPSRWFSGLSAKQAAITLLIALAFGLIGSATELYLDWRAKRAEIQQNMAQVLDMLQPAAAEAAYLLNEQLAMRVAAGLTRYTAVREVTLRDESGAVLAGQERFGLGEESAFAQKLFGDITHYQLELVRNGTKIGKLETYLSAEALAQDFFDRIARLAAVGILRALAISAVLVFFFYGMIIRPLLRLSRQVGAVNPAQPGATPIPPAPGHAKDEIGALIGALNRLLGAFQHGLAQRDQAQRELTALTRELEARVQQRTEALALAKTEIEALNRRLAAENLRMGAELDVSRKIQRMTLPTPDELEGIAGLDVATYMESAKEVGGDYYDILRDRDRLRISIGDVTGHGLESGVVMLMTQSAVRTLTTHAEGDLSRTLQALNRTIYDNVQRMGSDKNLTLALLDYQNHAHGGTLRVSGQHESVIVARADGRLELIDTTLLGMPLGLLDRVDEFLGEVEIQLAPQDVVALYTDGITEAANTRHQLYGLERLCQVILAHRAESTEDIKRAVVEDVMRHIGTQTIYDDLTLIVLKQKERSCAS